METEWNETGDQQVLVFWNVLFLPGISKELSP